MKNVNFWVSILRVSTWLQSVETEGRFGLAPSTPAACLALFPPLDRESFKHCGIFTTTSTQQNHVPVPNFRNPFFFPEGGSSPYFAEPGRPGRPGPTAEGEQRFQLSSPRLAQHGTGSIEQGVFAPWPAVEPLFMALGLPH